MKKIHETIKTTMGKRNLYRLTHQIIVQLARSVVLTFYAAIFLQTGFVTEPFRCKRSCTSMSSFFWGLSPLVTQSTWKDKPLKLVLLIITVAKASAIIVTANTLQEEVNRVAITASVAAVAAKWQGCQLHLLNKTTCALSSFTLMIGSHPCITIQTLQTQRLWGEDQRCRRSDALRAGGKRSRGVHKVRGTPEYLLLGGFSFTFSNLNVFLYPL